MGDKRSRGHIRRAVEEAYYLLVCALTWRFIHVRPIFGWQAHLCMSARFYFECCEEPEFSGWPWRWRMNFPTARGQ